jgi:uncharacterized protein YcbX
MPITLSALNVYPVKGFKGIVLDEAFATERGLEHDRRWMVVGPAGEMLTQRSHPKMATVWTELGDVLTLSAPDMASVDVPLVAPPGPAIRAEVWGNPVDAVAASPDADAWLSEYLGLACRLLYMPESTQRLSPARFTGGHERLVGFADAFAYLITGDASLADLNGRLAAKGHPALPMNRFRPNLVVSGSDAYAEDAWGEIRIGEAVLKSAKPCGRCQVTTTDQSTGEVQGPEPLATLATYRDSKEFGVLFGMNLVTVKPGCVRVGDQVLVSQSSGVPGI